MPSEPSRSCVAPCPSSDAAAVPEGLRPARLWRARSQRKGQILALHGAMTYSASFESVGPWLADAGYDVLAYDQRGFGPTENQSAWEGYEPLVADALAYARRLKAETPDVPLTLLGESMGGGIAALASFEAENGLVDGLVLAAPAVVTSPLRREVARVLSLGLTCVPKTAALPFDRLGAESLCDTSAVILLADPWVQRELTPALGAGLLDLAIAVGERATSIAVPTLIQYGTQEDVIPRPCLGRLAERIFGPAETDYVEGAPHMVLHYADQERVLGRIMRWLDARSLQSGQSARSNAPGKTIADKAAENTAKNFAA